MTRKLIGFAPLMLVFRMPVFAAASTGLPGINLGKPGESLGTSMQIVILLTLLTLLPAIVMSLTPFLRISIVLHFLRQAVGTQTTPSNQVLTGLALFLTMVTIQPLASQIYKDAWMPAENGQMTATQAFEAASTPLKGYLSKFVREKDVKLFLDLTHAPAPRNAAD